MKKKTFLVTGGTGFIGSNISNFLVDKGHNVKILDDNSRGSIKKIKKFKRKIKFIKGDIRDRKSVNKALKNTDAVIHLAYINGTKYFYNKPILVLDVAVKGILNVIDGCIKNGIKELYLASSSEVYQTPDKIPTDEKESLKIPNIFNPRYSYGGGKILTELMGVHYGKKYFKKLIIFRPHNVYGPNMGQEHVIPQFINRFKSLKGKNFKIQGTGNEIRSFIYIKDFLSAFNLILDRGKHLNIYNIGTMEEVSIKELATSVGKSFDKKLNIISSGVLKGSTPRRCPDISKIQRLGFRPKVSLDMGIEKLVDWYKSHAHEEQKINT